MTHAARAFWTALVVVAVAPALLAAEPKTQTEHMVVFMGDAKIGDGVEERTVTDEAITHSSVTNLTINRGQVAVSVATETETVETPAGEPVSFRHKAILGILGQMGKSGVFRDGKLHLTEQGFGGGQTQVVDVPAGLLMPEAVRRLRVEKGFAPGTTYKYLAFHPEEPSGAAVTVEVVGPERVELMGRHERLHRLTESATVGGNTMPGTTYVDDQGRVRKTTSSLMGTTLAIIAADAEAAARPDEPFDLLEIGTVPSPNPIPNARQTTTARFILRPTERGGKLAIPSTDSQVATPGPGGSVVVSVKLVANAKGTRPYAGEGVALVADDLAALQPSEFIQSNEPAIRTQARQIVGDQSDALAAARAIETWVANHVSDQTLSAGYASALETLTTGAGDCTEHSVLVAALCRAAGIPCRIVNGVAYTDQFETQRQRFIGHQWNQVLVGDKWVDIDAALGTDASRITLLVGAERPVDFLGMLQTLGKFDIVQARAR